MRRSAIDGAAEARSGPAAAVLSHLFCIDVAVEERIIAGSAAGWERRRARAAPDTAPRAPTACPDQMEKQGGT